MAPEHKTYKIKVFEIVNQGRKIKTQRTIGCGRAQKNVVDRKRYHVLSLIASRNWPPAVYWRTYMMGCADARLLYVLTTWPSIPTWYFDPSVDPSYLAPGSHPVVRKSEQLSARATGGTPGTPFPFGDMRST